MKKLDRTTRDAAIDDLVRQLAPIGEPRYDDLFLDWDGSRELVRRGFEIGSHTMAHMILAREDIPYQRKDLARSREILQTQLETRIELIAYPNGAHGDFSLETIDAARSAGYTHAVTTIHGRNTMNTHPYELRRCRRATRIWRTRLAANGRGTRNGDMARSRFGRHPDPATDETKRPAMKGSAVNVAIIGAGPYGLSIAAHLAANETEYRIFGKPMHTWKQVCPKVCSYGPKDSPRSCPIPLAISRWRATARAQALSRRMVRTGPARRVLRLRRVVHRAPRTACRRLTTRTRRTLQRRLRLKLPSGTDCSCSKRRARCRPHSLRLHARRNMLPPERSGFALLGAARLPRLGRTRRHGAGGGQSAGWRPPRRSTSTTRTYVSSLRPALNWHPVPPSLDRPLVERLKQPVSGLGMGWSCWCAERLPNVFRHLPKSKRVDIVARTFGPAGAWWLRDRVEGRIPMHLGRSFQAIRTQGERIVLEFNGPQGTETISSEHVVAATDIEPTSTNLHSSIRTSEKL